MKTYRTLLLATIAMTFALIVLGAYVRLSDAGLGCPDWPGCYGFLSVPEEAHEIEQAEALFPHAPVETHKAWPEMVHRYFAGALGLVIFALALLAWRERYRNSRFPVVLPTFLLGLVIFQALLGMWTVTLNLFPLVVMGHLLGGFATLSLLFLLVLKLKPKMVSHSRVVARKYKGLALLALIVLIVQIALGGWTSANYAALVCTDLPICEPGWLGRLDFVEGFKPWGHGVETYQYGVLNAEAMTAIHVSHRIGALVSLLVIGWLVGRLIRERDSVILRAVGRVIGVILLLQLALGVSNVVFLLPLPVAVAHNGVAALLLLGLVAVNYLVNWQFRGQQIGG